MVTTPPIELENVSALAFHIIVSKLSPAEAATLACVNKRFKDWASDDSLWFVFCSQELSLSNPLDPLGNPCPSFKATYRAWREAYGMYSWPLVKAKGCFVHEEAHNYLFAYSIRMSLKAKGCFVHGKSFDSCQLYWRHWIIESNNNVMGDLNGEAMIGQFPMLRSGQKEFVYESCTTFAASPGSMEEGSFTFIPGRLADPKGDPFEVEVARFPLVLPDYIF